MNDDLATAMQSLEEPAPPVSLKATVMARLARDADRPDAAAGRLASARRRHEAPAWLWAAGGLAIVLAASVYGWWATGSLPDVTSPRIGRVLPATFAAEPGAVLLGLGLLIYIAGLLAPLRDRRTPPAG